MGVANRLLKQSNEVETGVTLSGVKRLTPEQREALGLRPLHPDDMVIEAKPETKHSRHTTKETKLESKVESDSSKKMPVSDYALIKSLRGQAEADRIKAEYENTGSKPEAVKHLTDIAKPQAATAKALATLTNQLPAEYALVAQFINSDEKPKRKELESQIAEWALQNPKVMK